MMLGTPRAWEMASFLGKNLAFRWETTGDFLGQTRVFWEAASVFLNMSWVLLWSQTLGWLQVYMWTVAFWTEAEMISSCFCFQRGSRSCCDRLMDGWVFFICFTLNIQAPRGLLPLLRICSKHFFTFLLPNAIANTAGRIYDLGSHVAGVLNRRKSRVWPRATFSTSNGSLYSAWSFRCWWPRPSTPGILWWTRGAPYEVMRFPSPMATQLMHRGLIHPGNTIVRGRYHWVFHWTLTNIKRFSIWSAIIHHYETSLKTMKHYQPVRRTS